MFVLATLLATVLLFSAEARVNGPCSYSGRAGTCLSTSSCKGSTYRGTSGCIKDPASVTCCVQPTCTANGKSGRCYKTSVCAGLGQQAVASSAGANGCQREPGNVQCCVARATTSTPRPSTTTPRPVAPVPTPPVPVAVPPSSRPCTAFGVRGSCITTSSCRARSGYTHHRSSAGRVTGCERDPASVQCCYRQASAAQPTAVPPAPSGGSTGGLPDSGVLTKCQVARHLQAAGVPASYLARMTCTAYYESRFNCAATNLRNANGSGDYGLMQCNSQYWCSGGIGPNRGADCGVSCSALTRSCSTAARCAALILRRQGIRAWYGYTGHQSTCDRYSISECGLSGGVQPSPSPPQAVAPPTSTAARTCQVGVRRGVCIQTTQCTGSRESVPNHCPLDPASVRCCVQRNTPTPPAPRPQPAPVTPPVNTATPGYGATPSTSCDIVAPSCSRMRNVGSQPFRVDREFMPYLSEYNRCLIAANTRIVITSSYRNIAENNRVRGARSSNHLVGHAIDMNIVGSNGRNCNMACMRTSSKHNIPGVQATIDCWNRLPAPSRYGGNPAFGIRISSGIDSVHLDDNINRAHSSKHSAKINSCNADRSFATVSCGSGGTTSGSLPSVGPPAPTPCTAHGNAGTCKVTSECTTQSFGYVANLVTGCRHLAANVRCCVNGVPRGGSAPIPEVAPAPEPEPETVVAPPSANTCTSSAGVSGRCIDVATCTGNNISERNRCPNDPGHVRCCFQRGAQPPATPGVARVWLARAGRFTVVRNARDSRARGIAHARAVNKFLLHTIENNEKRAGALEGGLATLDRNRSWPHFLVGLNRAGTMTIQQLMPMDRGGRALRSGANQLGAIQVEVCGSAERPFTSSDAATTEAVRALFQAVRAEFPAIANRAPFRFDGDSAYGSRGSVRQSSSAFSSASGLVGHQHAPFNTHWDPGAINPAALFCASAGCGASVARFALDVLPTPETQAIDDNLFPGYDVDVNELKCMFPPVNGRPSDDHFDLFVPLLNVAIEEFEVGQTYESVTSFLAEAAYDTNGFTTFQQRDEATCSSLTGGCQYTRRGLLGLKASHDYEMLSAALGAELLEKPELVATPKYAFRVAAAMWQAKKVGLVADKGEFSQVSKIVAGCRDCSERVRTVETYRQRVKSCLPKYGYEETMQARAQEACYVLNKEDTLNSGKRGLCMPLDKCGGELDAEPVDWLSGESEMMTMMSSGGISDELLDSDLLGSPSHEQRVEELLAEQDAMLLPDDEGVMPPGMAGVDPSALRGWVHPRAVWKWKTLFVETEVLPEITELTPPKDEKPTDWNGAPPAAKPSFDDVTTISGASYNHSSWLVGRAPFGYGDEERGIVYKTSFEGYESDVYYRLTFTLTQSDLNELNGKMLRLSIASDDSARVAINGKVVLEGDDTLQRDAVYFNDLVELPASTVRVGENVIAVLVYNVAPATDAFFDLDLSPQAPLSDADRAAAASGDCRAGSLGCECVHDTAADVMRDMADPNAADAERSTCDDGLVCDVYAKKCFYDWDSTWDPEIDLNYRPEAEEANEVRSTNVAGFCSNPEHVCCIAAHVQSDELFSGHGYDADSAAATEFDLNDPLLTTPYIGEGQEAVQESSANTITLTLFALISFIVAMF